MNNYWRDSGREIKFWIFDWKLSITVLILIFNASRLWAYVLVFITLMFFQYLNKKGYNLSNFIRYINSKLIGKKAHGKPYWFRRKYF